MHYQSIITQTTDRFVTVKPFQFDFYLRESTTLIKSFQNCSTCRGHRLRLIWTESERRICYVPLLLTAGTFLIHVIHLMDQKGHFFFFDGDRFEITTSLDKGGSNFMPIPLAYIYHKHHKCCSPEMFRLRASSGSHQSDRVSVTGDRTRVQKRTNCATDTKLPLVHLFLYF